MKRDNDYIRDFLLKFEEQKEPLLYRPPTMDGGDIKERHHIHLLCDKGYMVEINEGVYRLTNSGHDFIEAIRDEGIWNRTKQQIADTGGNVTLEIIKTLATGLLKKKISYHTGIEL